MELKLKIDINSGRKVWISSDFHYGHVNICRGVSKWKYPDGSVAVDRTRQYDSVEEMNKVIVDNINACVGEDDVLIFVGDWAMGGFENIAELRKKLKCKEIHFVNGNHDQHIRKNKNNYQSLFTSVCDYLILTIEYYDSTITGNQTKVIGWYQIIISHFPIQSWENLNKGAIHLHGHCHLMGDKRFGRGRKMDIGIDGHPEFRPYEIYDECIRVLRAKEILSDMLFDHHTDELI